MPRARWNKNYDATLLVPQFNKKTLAGFLRRKQGTPAQLSRYASQIALYDAHRVSTPSQLTQKLYPDGLPQESITDD